MRWLAALFILGLLISPLASDPVATVAATMSLLAVAFIASASQDILGEPDTFRAVALGIAAFALASLILAYPGTDWNWAIGDGQATRWGLPRRSGFAAEPMHLSLLAGLGAILALSTIQRSGTTLRYALLGVLAISSVGTLLGQGRMPIFALTISALWFLLHAGSAKSRLALLGIVTVVVAVLLVAAPTQVLRRKGNNENLSGPNGSNVI